MFSYQEANSRVDTTDVDVDVDVDVDGPVAEDVFGNSLTERMRRQDRNHVGKLHRPKRTENELRADLGLAHSTVDISATGFNPSFHGSRHERAWILSGLGSFYDGNLISDVIRPVKGGKEASVYCCAAGQSMGVQYLAGKVYRPRMFRQLRNDKIYREGRKIMDADGKPVKDEGAIHAITTGTRFGKELLHTSWLAHEYEALCELHAVGALVPKPYASAPNAILMEYLGDAETPAPTLNTVALDSSQARAVFDRLIESVKLMLAANRVHGDLSAYNVLYWEGQVRIIDFPQVVNVDANPRAYRIFQRDMARLCDYFESYGMDVDAAQLAEDLWRAQVGRLTEAERRAEDQMLRLDAE